MCSVDPICTGTESRGCLSAHDWSRLCVFTSVCVCVWGGLDVSSKNDGMYLASD